MKHHSDSYNCKGPHTHFTPDCFSCSASMQAQTGFSNQRGTREGEREREGERGREREGGGVERERGMEREFWKPSPRQVQQQTESNNYSGPICKGNSYYKGTLKSSKFETLAFSGHTAKKLSLHVSCINTSQALRSSKCVIWPPTLPSIPGHRGDT